MSSVAIRTRTISDGSRRYDVRYRRGGRYFPVEHGGTFHTLREAKIRRDLVASWLAGGLDPRVELARILAPAQTIAEAQSAWLDSRRRVSVSTLRTYRYHAARVDRDLGSRPVSALGLHDVIAWVAALERDYRPGTVRLYLTQLRMILDFVGVPNVARDRRVEVPRDLRPEPNPPDAPEVKEAIEGLDGGQRLAIVALEQLGSRISETLALTREDVDRDGMRVRFRREVAKQSRPRWVAGEPFLVDALMERLPLRGTRSSVGAALAQAGGFWPHQLRHRRASLWHQAGVDPVELARRLGHARPSLSLDRYAHVKPLREIPAHELEAFLR